MTREEAIEIIKQDIPCEHDTDLIEALEMAIKALEQEPNAEKIIKMRDATPEEKESIDKYIKSISKPTGVDFWNLEQEPCDDAISRQAVLESIKDLYPDMPIINIFGARRKWLEKYAPYFECENAIEQLSSVNPQPKTGHWILGICDNCRYDWGKDTPIASVPNFCPNCGRRMVEPQERESDV